MNVDRLMSNRDWELCSRQLEVGSIIEDGDWCYSTDGHSVVFAQSAVGRPVVDILDWYRPFTDNPSLVYTDKELLDKALSGSRGEDQKLIAEEVVRWGALLIRKNTDYGSSVWKTPRLAPECDPGTAIRVRMSDKLSRLEQLLSKPAMVDSESIDDTIRDLGAYCLLELARPNRRLGYDPSQPVSEIRNFTSEYQPKDE